MFDGYTSHKARLKEPHEAKEHVVFNELIARL